MTGAGGMPTLRNQMSHNMALVERMREIANRHKRSVGEVAIAWTLRHPVVPAPSSVPAISARQRESCARASCTSTRSKPLPRPRLDRVRNTGRAGAKGWLTLRDYGLRALLATPFARQLIAVMASKKAPKQFQGTPLKTIPPTIHIDEARDGTTEPAEAPYKPPMISST